MAKTLKKIIDYNDLKEASFNFAVAWGLGNAANIISNAVFHFDLNRYNSVDHLAMGVGIGTLAYRKAGKGAKGIFAGLIAASLFNGCWEYFENRYVFQSKELDIDTITDIAAVYAGSIIGFLGEKLKRKNNNP
jgi:hypothetical protein